jgi:hypothetical protein
MAGEIISESVGGIILERRAASPGIGSRMNEVVTIAPLGGDPGLIAYECSKCAHLMSVLYQAPWPA